MTWRRFAAPALAAVLLGTAASAADRRKVIIDQDAFGGVNLQSLLMVIESPDVEVVGITVESGDGWQKESVAQTLRMLELIGRPDIPVAAGATFPLINSEEETARWETLYGKLPYKGAWMRSWPSYNTRDRPGYHPPEVVPPLPEGMPTLRPVPEPAAIFLTEKVRAYPGQITILALGPFTNIALAAKLDESFAANAQELVFMGGGFNPDASHLDEFSRQFRHNPRVEFNFRWDPEAGRIMLRAGWKRIVAVPLDPCVPTRMTPALAQEVEASGTPAARYFAQRVQVGFPLWDETAAAIWLDPGLIRQSDRMAVDVSIDHDASYGAMLTWPAGGGPGLGEPEVEMVQTIDVPGLERLIVRLLGTKGSAP